MTSTLLRYYRCVIWPRWTLYPSAYLTPDVVCVSSQLSSDLIPLRVLPPILLAGITTLMVGFRGGQFFLHYTFALVRARTDSPCSPACMSE